MVMKLLVVVPLLSKVLLGLLMRLTDAVLLEFKELTIWAKTILLV
jgi:hypothetical protein